MGEEIINRLDVAGRMGKHEGTLSMQARSAVEHSPALAGQPWRVLKKPGPPGTVGRPGFFIGGMFCTGADRWRFG